MLDLITAPIVDAVASHLGVPAASVSTLFAPPAKGVPADLALPCFQLAKTKGVAPPVLATDLALMLNAKGVVQATAAGPFLNLTFTAASVAGALLPVLAKDPVAALRSE